MELQERVSILTQGAELACKAGVLTLKEASFAQQAIDAFKQNVSHKEAFEILIKIAQKGQKNGAYTLQDAYLLYLASQNYESSIPVPVQAQPVPQPAPQPAPQVVEQPEKKTRKKES